GTRQFLTAARHVDQIALNLNVKIKKKFHCVYAHISLTIPRNGTALPLHLQNARYCDDGDPEKCSEINFPLLQSDLQGTGKICHGNNTTPHESDAEDSWGVVLFPWRSEEHTSELQSRENLVCRLLLEKKKKKKEAQSERRTRTR